MGKDVVGALQVHHGAGARGRGRGAGRLSGEQLAFIGLDAPEYAQELDLRWRVLRKPLGHGREAVSFPFEA